MCPYCFCTIQYRYEPVLYYTVLTLEALATMSLPGLTLEAALLRLPRPYYVCLSVCVCVCVCICVCIRQSHKPGSYCRNPVTKLHNAPGCNKIWKPVTTLKRLDSVKCKRVSLPRDYDHAGRPSFVPRRICFSGWMIPSWMGGCVYRMPQEGIVHPEKDLLFHTNV